MAPAERKALLFVSFVAALGAAVRVAGSGADVPPPPAARRALARQIQAVDSAQRATGRANGGRRGSKVARRTEATVGAARAPSARARGGERAAESASLVVDLDVAPAAEIERLPRIGPALARRIVADRESLGAFGSLSGLERVRGVGPGVAAAVRPHVTFSGTPRPSNAASRGRPRPSSP